MLPNWQTIIGRIGYFKHWLLSELPKEVYLFFLGLFKGKEAVREKIMDDAVGAVKGGHLIFMIEIIQLFRLLGQYYDHENPSIRSRLFHDIVRWTNGYTDDPDFRKSITLECLAELDTAPSPEKRRDILLKWLLKSGDIKSHQAVFYRKAIDTWIKGKI